MWKGRRVILRFEGVGSAFYVWINGKRVGYAEDSKLPSEFDVTEFLTTEDTEHTEKISVVSVCSVVKKN